VIRNTSAQVHPFHIHVNPFQVIAVNGQPVEAPSYEDTANLPALGSITMRTRFLDFPGNYVYHCHILMHEDNGMMGIIEVQP
jgi:FtsP/CotA-like multicopper oxidase with cupredoxin domain